MHLVDILIGLIIFGYAGYSLVRFTKKAKKGKCATCEVEPTCKTACDDVNWDHVIAEALKK
ncbi:MULTISPECIES: FeoB-associated Cys-rich membrane protein [unclassified Exiguobacterium]|uniref:FeoB-associated Cys-rich membrane protein n=1 Tax=unclassified Exiguobacterium TaxID=2644629 RepID=UPI000B587E35|nr:MULTISPECIES: FeoB-associated Cys-rich membrane protein [unclassified Exiguobacterium]ASI34805.1 FeoB-associated Cys-rich membrane protein [Exiguobacterium sp. N4-1P]ASK36341.1 FeoB-associated Cys-rich membrane protein [Alcanivorax sp. N3-2A]